nr:AAA family ATPase [Spirochaeta cellobiosiphila]
MWNKDHIKIAISGKSGCGNTTITKMLAQKLSLRQINYTFRDIAKEKNMDFHEFYEIAVKDHYWDKYLDNKQIEMASSGRCVLGSRLAIWLFKEANFRVYLHASEEVRAKRIHKREGGTLEQVIERTQLRDHNDWKRYNEIYGIDINNWDFVDLEIDAGTNSPEDIVDIILNKLEACSSRFTK